MGKSAGLGPVVWWAGRRRERGGLLTEMESEMLESIPTPRSFVCATAEPALAVEPTESPELTVVGPDAPAPL